MKKITLYIDEILKIESASLFVDHKVKAISHISIDSRNIKKGSLFVAIKGEKLDGHCYIKNAVAKGAKAILINKKYEKKIKDIDCTIITVEDTTKAFSDLANIWRSKLAAKIISITGTNGKTSTKDMLAEILSIKYKVNKTQANNNNHIGVPLTILSTDNSYDYLVLEHGTNHFGEIEYTAKIAEPDYSMITNIGDSHLEFLRDRNGVFEEKKKLFDYVKPSENNIFLNLDDNYLKGLKKKFNTCFTYSFKQFADVKGKLNGFTYDGKSILNITFNNESKDFILPLYGAASAKNFLLCAAFVLSQGFTFEELNKSLNLLKEAPGRLNIISYDKFILIDDTYNSNPASMENAIELLQKNKTYKKRILIIGDMFELGKSSLEKHLNLFKPIQKAFVSEVYTIGEMMKYLNLKLKENNVIAKHFQTANELGDFLQNYSFEKSIVLVKGSRGMKMEQYVKILKEKGE